MNSYGVEVAVFCPTTSCGHTPVGERDFMIGSRRAAITASLLGALLVTGAPTFAFGDGDSTHTAKAYSAQAASDDMTAQKAKDGQDKGDNKKADNKGGEDKKASDNKKSDNKQAADNKKASDNKKSDNKKSDDNKQAADKKKSDDNKKWDDNKRADDNKKSDNRKSDDNKQAADKKKSDDNKKWDDNKRKSDDRKKSDEAADRKRADDDKKWDNPHRDDWKNRKHDDKWDRDWDHNRDRDHRRHDWDTNRHYYRYGYYGPGWYDDCGYYSPGYDGYGNDYSYYGPDACRYQYGGYQSHFLVDMSWDQEVPRPGPGGAVGTANIDIDVPAGRLCFRLAYDGIDRAIGAQIHPGRIGEGGPNLVLLHVGENGDDGCVGVDPQILSEIQNDPRGYYLEIDDEAGPAMRGQLDAPDYRNRY
jgi:hypothetical protein